MTLWPRFWLCLALGLLLIFIYGCASLASREATLGCQAADAVSTAIVLRTTSAHEANPIMAGVIKNLGMPGFFAIKALIAWALIESSAPDGVKAGVNVVSCGIAAQNVAVGMALGK